MSLMVRCPLIALLEGLTSGRIHTYIFDNCIQLAAE